MNFHYPTRELTFQLNLAADRTVACLIRGSGKLEGHSCVDLSVAPAGSAGQLAEVRRTGGGYRVRIVDVIERVERVGPDLQARRLGQAKHFSY